MAQTPEERKAAIAKARKAHHEAQTAEKKRLDTYVMPDTKDGLKTIKKHFDDVKNEGQAVDRAVELALKTLEQQ